MSKLKQAQKERLIAEAWLLFRKLIDSHSEDTPLRPGVATKSYNRYLRRQEKFGKRLRTYHGQ